jgi:hypothetical protein
MDLNLSDVAAAERLMPSDTWGDLSRSERFERAGSFVINLLSRTELIRSLIGDERRNMFKACHIPEPGTMSAEQYYTLASRCSVGGRVCEVLAKEAWQVTPNVYEEEDGETATEFEDTWDTITRDLLAMELEGGKNYYQDEAGNPVWEALSRADVLSGVGRYGTILFGLDDRAENMSLPVARKKGMRLLSIDAFTEAEMTVAEYETDRRSPRYRMPRLYQMNTRDEPTAGGSMPPHTNELIHWTRVQHLCDTHHQARSSRVFAAPRQEPVLNEIYGLLKLILASPEMYWKGAFMGLALKTQPQTGGDVPLNKDKLRQMMSDYENDLQRWIGLVGMDAQSLAPQISDPTPFVDKMIELICVKLGIPVRIFKGSERGELASSQDDKAWNDRLKERQQNYITPRIVIPFVNRLIWFGVLPAPKGFSVYWPDLTSKSDQEKAQVALTRTQALKQYAADPTQLIAPFDYLTQFLGYEDAEAETMMENAEEYLAEKAEEEAKMAEEAQAQAMDKTEEMIARGLAPDPTVTNKPPKAPPGTPAAAAANPFVKNAEGDDDLTDNANPEGCNQYTGPGCSVGGAAAGSTVHFHGPTAPGAGWTSGGENVWVAPGEKAGTFGKLFGKKDKAASTDVGKTTPDTLQARMESNPKYVAARGAVEARNAGAYAKLAETAGGSVSKVRADIRAKAQKLVDDSDVYVRVSEGTLGKILDGGRFKNLHETGVGTALSNKAQRTLAEERGMGVPPGDPPAVKPLSGYLGGRNFSTVGVEKGADAYGDIVVKLRESVKDRSTVNFGDSLSEINNGYAVASPLRKLSEVSVNPKEILHNPRLLDSHDGYHSTKGFIEANVHGGVSASEIEEIGFPSEPSAAIKSALTDRGIKFRVYQRK